MATSGKLQDDFLTCSVCMEVYQQPVTLGCQHSFCKKCLGAFIITKAEALRKKSIPCPTCRQETPVPHPDRPVEEWAGQLKPGLLLTGLMDSFKATVTCSSCKEEGETTPATHWCSECEANFCDVCLKMHRKMPISSKHIVTILTEPTNSAKSTSVEPDSGEKVKRKFPCKVHNKKMKLFCKDCKKPLCTVCCSIAHRKCENVVTIEEMLPELKGQLQERQTMLQMHIEDTGDAINDYEMKIQKRSNQEMVLTSELEKTFHSIVEHVLKKKDQILKKLTDETETFQLKSKIKTKQIDLEMYQQQSQVIQQALELEDEAQLFEMYLSSGSGVVSDVTETESEDVTDIADVKFILELGQLKAAIDNLDLKTEGKEVKLDVIDLTAQPVLLEVTAAKSHKDDTISLRDVVVLRVKDIKVTVVTDYSGNKLKSFYTVNGTQQYSILVLGNFPRCIAVMKDNTVAVSIPFSKQIVTVNVNPDLELHSTISTDKKYYGLDVLDQSILVASSVSPPSIDILDIKGRVMRSLQTLPEPHRTFRNPFFIRVNIQGNILVSDSGLKSVICLTQTGHAVWIYTPTGDRALDDPRGITSTRTGDILVAARNKHKVVHLTESGKFVKDICTVENGLNYPHGLCLFGEKLCVANTFKGVQEYRFA